MKFILSSLLTVSLLTGGALLAGDNQGSPGKSHSGSKKNASGSHRSNRTGHRKKDGNVPSGK